MVRLVHLPTKLPQVNLHSTHPVVLPHLVVVKQGNVNEVVKLLVPVSSGLLCTTIHLCLILTS